MFAKVITEVFLSSRFPWACPHYPPPQAKLSLSPSNPERGDDDDDDDDDDQSFI